MASKNADILTITRIFDAQVEAVWKAWSDPEMVKKWWGPKDFTCPVANIDFKVGGKSHVAMHGPKGTEWDKDLWSTGTYREIVPNKKIVTTDSFADEKGNVVPASYYGMSDKFPMELKITVEFEEYPPAGGGKTKMKLTHEGMPEGKDKEGANEGWNQSFDKLADILAKASKMSKTNIIVDKQNLEVRMSRVFDAPREQVWEAHVNPHAIEKWWGPRRYETEVEKLDARKGGDWKFINKDKEEKHVFYGQFRDIDKPKKIVWTFTYEPYPDQVIEETLNLESLPNQKTKVSTLSKYPSKDALEGMVQGGMEEGASESWDRLEELLEKS